jgi:hypothetical protein
MRIDAKQLRWVRWAVAALVVATWIYYRPYADQRRHVSSPGSTWTGLAYGTAGTLCILFAAALGLRKRFLLWRVGPVVWWMRGHLWLGLLSLFLILYHGAGVLGGPLTAVLMYLLFGTIATGVFGAGLQHFMPQLMTGVLAEETPYEQIDRAFAELRAKAFALASTWCGVISGTELEEREAKELGVKVPRGPNKEVPEPEYVSLRRFYSTRIKPFLRNPRNTREPLAKTLNAAVLFDQVRKEVSLKIHEDLAELAKACDDSRTMARQERLHHWLHVWMLVHLGLAMGLVALIPFHVLLALYY